MSLSQYYGEEALPPKVRSASARRQSLKENAYAWASEEDELDEDQDMHEDPPPPVAPRIPERVPQLVPIPAPHPVSHQPPPPFESRAMYSGLSASYNQSFLRGGKEESNSDTESSDEASPQQPATKRAASASGSTSVSPYNQPKPRLPSPRDIGMHDGAVDNLLRVWGSGVQQFQYRFAEPEYSRELYQIIHNDQAVQEITKSEGPRGSSLPDIV